MQFQLHFQLLVYLQNPADRGRFVRWVYRSLGEKSSKETGKNNTFKKQNFVGLVKFTTWKIWRARNAAAFSEEFTSPDVVALRSNSMLAEFINHISWKKDLSLLSKEERSWLSWLDNSLNSHSLVLFFPGFFGNFISLSMSF